MRGNFTSFNPIKQAASNLITAATAKTKKPQSDNNHRGVTHKLDVMCVCVCVCVCLCVRLLGVCADFLDEPVAGSCSM